MARKKHARHVARHLARMTYHGVIPKELSMDSSCYRPVGEVDYVQELAVATKRNSERDVNEQDNWSGTFGVRQDGLLFTKPLLRKEFRFLHKEGRYWSVCIPRKRSPRSRTGFLAPYQSVEIDSLIRRELSGRFVQINRRWACIEVPRGCNAELPPVLTYL